MTKVWIDPQPMENGLVAVDVNLSGAPMNLFGAAFHVNISGVDWKLSGYHMGTVFGGSEPFLLVSEKDGVLITGISLRRAEPATIRDGKLITFYIHPLKESKISFGFDYPVLSTYQDERKDVEDVEWIGATVFEDRRVEMESSDGTQESLELNLESAQVNALSDDIESTHPLTNMYGFFFESFTLFFICMMVFTLYFWWKRQ